MPAVEEPPTGISENDRMFLDPDKVIKAWMRSADVLKDVAAAVRENQEDNDLTRTVSNKNRRWFLGMTLVNLAAVVGVVFSVQRAVSQVSSEAEQIREESQAMTKAMSSVLASSVAQEETDKERAALEAEVTVAAVQAKVATDPKEKARAQEKAKDALSRAKERSPVIGPVSVDSELIEDL